jgi:hypothetical protein
MKTPAALQREIDRAAAFQARLDAIGAAMGTLPRTHGADWRVQELLFRILGDLLARFAGFTMMGEVYKVALADVAALLAEATAQRRPPEEVHARADALASRLFCRVGPGSWPLDLQVPFDLATLLRRACEPRPSLLLPVAVLDVMRLLDVTKMRRDPEPIDALIAKATGGTWRWPIGPSAPPIEDVPQRVRAVVLYEAPPRALAPEVYEEDTDDERPCPACGLARTSRTTTFRREVTRDAPRR